MAKGFVISDDDLKKFEEWVKKPGSVEKILEAHAEKMKKAQPFFDRLERMQIISRDMINKPFTI